MSIYAIHTQAAPPSGISQCISARLTPSCLHQEGPSSFKSRIIRNLVTARNNYLQVFEVVEELPAGGAVSSSSLSERAKVNGESQSSRGQVNGHAHDQTTTGNATTNHATARLQFVREHRLHGTITGLQRIQTIDTARDGLDRLLISFTDAKASLLEWSADHYDLVALSLHTFEKLPQIVQGDLSGYRPILRTDPLSRCSALSLPQDAIAITPFFQDQIELEGADPENMASLPYAPSFVIELLEVSPQLRNVVDFVFLPGFNEPTMAVISQPIQTWTARLESVTDTVQLFLITLDVTSTPPSSTIISTTASLPFDSLYLTPCPKDLGGVLVTTPNAILHIDQAGKRTGLAFNGWANQVTELSRTEAISEEPRALEDSKIMFVMSDVALVFLHDGRVRAIRVQRDGRTISRLTLLPDTLGKSVPACDIELIRSHLSPRATDGSTQACYAFVASLVGDSQVLRVDFQLVQDVNVNGDTGIPENKLEEREAAMDEDDLDIYGSADAKADAISAENAARVAAITRLDLETSVCQTLPAYGPIRGAALGTVEQDAPPELVACTGGEETGGLTILHRSLLPAKRRKLNLDHSTESIWSVRVKQTEGELEYKNYLFTSSEGETQIYTLDNDPTEPDYVKTYGKTTLAAHALLDSTCIVYLLPTAVVLLNGDLSERQRINLPKDVKAKSASIADPYILVSTDEAEPLLYSISQDSGRLQLVPLAPPIASTSRVTLFQDSAPAYPARKRRARRFAQAPDQRISTDQDVLDIANNDDDIYGEPSTSSLQIPNNASMAQEPEDGDSDAEATTGAGTEARIWLCTCTDKGVLSISCLPDFDNVFQTSDVFTLPTTLADTRQTESEEDMPEEAVLETICITNVGRTRQRPHMILLFEDGTCVAYEAVPDYGRTAYLGGKEKTLGLRWLKVHSRTLGAAKAKRAGAANGADDGLGPAARRIIPFAGFGEYSGLIVTGESPLWILAEDTASSRIFDCTMKPVYGFCTTEADPTSASCIFSLGEETYIAEMPETIDLGRELPYTKVVQDRLYTGIVFDQPSQSFVAMASYPAPFEIFDDEGEPINSVHAETLLQPTASRSTLELIEPGSWKIVDGYEFRQYETALSIAVVNLESKSTSNGYRDFIAVGTIITRGEDLASRGALYVFEVVNGEPARKEANPRRYLRMLCMEDLKSAVTAVAALDGYLVHSLGLKIYTKAFDQDERLLAVGFLDVGMYTSCIKAMKNLVLLGDAVQGLNFIAFQEDPYKMISLGREVRGNPVVTTDFLILENKSAFVSTDTNGIIRLYEYDPMRVETQAGQRLLPRIEYRAGAEAAMSMPFARAVAGDAKQNGILILHTDGSISTIVPVRDAVYKRLQLLERQLIRHTHHFAGLNPRAFRTVRNDYIPRPLTKGLLDGDLLSSYTLLSTQKQQHLADPLGSDSDTINYNLRSLKAPW